MNNLKFPHFIFKGWFYHYAFLITHIKLSPDEFITKLEEGEFENEFWDMHDRFYAQIHNEKDESESWDIPTMYLELLQEFNCFMICLDTDPTKEQIYEHIVDPSVITDDMKKNIDTVLNLLEIVK